MNLIKKTLGIFILSIVTFGGYFTVNAQAPSVTTNFGTTSDASGVGVKGAGEAGDQSLIGVIKSFVNWTLGMLALISLIILLRGGFNMITAAGDDAKYKKGFTILKQAGIGLGFIALSWLIVSLIFFVLNAIGAQG